MPSAPQIRKLILLKLDQFILPALQTQAIIQILAEPPFDFSPAPHWTLQEKPLQRRESSPLDMMVRWPESFVLSTKFDYLGFIYGGASEERAGITADLARQLKIKAPGVTSYRLIAPAVFYAPSGIPRHDGQHPFDESERRSYGPLRIMSFEFTPNEMFLHMFEEESDVTQHSLHIPDPDYQRIIHDYANELRAGRQAPAQLKLIEFMNRLRHYLRSHRTNVGNSCWLNFSEEAISIDPSAGAKDIQLCYKVIEYIYLHLHTALTLTVLAQVGRVNPAHLNRIFTRTVGMTLMRYVTECRISAAKHILIDSDERIGDIAKLLGFSSSNCFSVVFRRHAGISARDYRLQYRAMLRQGAG